MRMFKVSTKTYKAPEISAVEVERVTEQCVCFPNGRRENKKNSWYVYLETWQTARAFLIQLWENTATHRRKELLLAETNLAKAQAIPEVSHAD